MESKPWFSISFSFITYIFLILLGVAIVATCFSCLAFIACCNCIGEKESHLIKTKCTSLTVTNDSVVVNENQIEHDLVDNPPYSRNTSINKGISVHPPLIENAHKVETKVCICENVNHHICQPGNTGSTLTHVITNTDSANGNHKLSELNSRRPNSSQVISRQWSDRRGLINPDSIETDV